MLCRLCITDIQFCTRNLVDAYMSGENLQDRARTFKYFEHLVSAVAGPGGVTILNSVALTPPGSDQVTELKALEQNLEFAWWEQASHGLQLQSIWIIPTAAVS